MRSAALAAWAVTALGGALMVVIWIAKGAFRAPTTDVTAEDVSAPNVEGTRTEFPLDVLVPHASLAVTGLILWMLFVANADQADYSSFAWSAVGGLAIVIPLGIVLVRIWARNRRRTGEVRLAEQSLPTALVILHGLGAALTFGLALAAALSVT